MQYHSRQPHDLTPWGIGILLLAIALQVTVSRVTAQEEDPDEVQTFTVRLTYYNLNGFTITGEAVHYGGTACSWNFLLGTRFRLNTGDVFICNDRGLLGSTGWLDLWNRPDLVRLLGDYTTVEVLP